MNLQRILSLAAAIGAIVAAAAVCVVAASFALYALAREYLGPAGGGAVVAAVFALVAVIIAWIATRKVTPKTKATAAPPPSPLDKAIGMAKEHPVVAAGAAAVAVAVLLRNPATVAALVSAFLAGNNTAPPKK
ncbi:hypothetical protein [Phenylobacterium sp.]|uniref:hypothetical protein n=1 Tax=Phenylobacterium sp. TaxID=1871053 RepID=UPI0025CDBCBB|nr:hypothetical protein [Phenylobacterium sp.]